MDLKRIADKAKDLVDRRGGTGSLKEDATELKDIATGQGSLADKAKAAAEAVKDPGADAAQEVGQRVEEAVPDESPAEAAEGRPRRGRGEGGRGRRRRRARGV